MEIFARNTVHKDIPAVELSAGGYYAVVAPSMGSAVLRLRNEEKGVEVFRYSDDISIREIMCAPEIWGLPTLFLPNRFDGGTLRISDNVYKLPVNETRFGNHLHGFVHKRVYKVKDMGVTDSSAYVVNEYLYDENDYFYVCFPVKFRISIKIELSQMGLEHTVTIENLSDKMLPISLATHTTINAPFVDGGKQENITLQVPVVEKIIFDKKRWLPTDRRISVRVTDKEYLYGTKCPVLHDICNDMYSMGTITLDGVPFRGTVMKDKASGIRICNEVDEKYKFWIIWNDKGFKNYFCPEPMTAMVNAPNLDLPRELTGYEELEPSGVYTARQRFFVK
ncbi:MAG: aldose 1-epimerase [Oscillospiraceae bacterium]|nr:aldose 1-epimerase [Oscillospiraceae bacterium]